MRKETQGARRRDPSTIGADPRRAAVLAVLGARGPSSRADLARELAVSPALITQIVRALLAEDLVRELEAVVSPRGGRPSKLLTLSPNSAHAVGIKVVADHMALVEVALDGEVTRSAVVPLDSSSPTAVSQIADHARDFVGSSPSARILGVGVGVPGIVDSQESGVVDSTQLDWHRVALGASLRQELELPVVVENNVNALSLAERLFGPGRGFEDFLVVTIGTGVGAGILSEGRILRGSTGSAGDFGHVPVLADGPVCQCGNRGCLESLICEEALIRSGVADGAIEQGQTVDDLREAADAGDESACAVFAEAGGHLGRALAGAVNIVDPEAVIVSGEGVQAWRFWRTTFETAFRSALVPAKRTVPVIIEEWQDEGWARGAAALVLATPFDSEGIAGGQGKIMRERLVSGGGDGR